MLAIGLAAIDSTIVATAVPQIVADLGGFSLFPWIFSIYLLTQAVTVPIYGRLSDVFGRKPVLLFGIAGFLVGSVLCAVAWSMVTLIIFRGLQGLAAGAILPTTTTIVGDLYEPAERGKVQGWISSVWGVSAIVGPTLGGFFAEYWTWRGIFWLNLPIGVGAAWLIHRHLHERVERRTHRIDYAGAATLTAACSLLILALLEGGVSWAWGSTTSFALFAGSARSARRVRVDRANRRRADPAALGLPASHPRRRQRLRARDRRDPDRADDIRPDVRAARRRCRRGRRRARDGDDDDRLADRGDARAARLSPHRLPTDRARRRRRSRSAAACSSRSSSAPTRASGASASQASCSASGSASSPCRPSSRCSRPSGGRGAASSPAPTCSSGRSGAPSGSPCSAGSRTAVSRTAATRAPAIFHAVHGVFWALVVVAVLGVGGQLVFPRRVTPLE